MYMPGRFRTASSPSSTDIELASYVLLFAMFLSFLSFFCPADRHGPPFPLLKRYLSYPGSYFSALFIDGIRRYDLAHG